MCRQRDKQSAVTKAKAIYAGRHKDDVKKNAEIRAIISLSPVTISKKRRKDVELVNAYVLFIIL
jgi:hypothetical protein